MVASEWEGGLRGALQDNGNTIRWANGTAWFRVKSAAPSLSALAGTWTCDGKPTTIAQDTNDPNRLVFTNQNGLKSTGSFANPTTVVATQWEGGLRGSLQDNGNTIRWANGTAWFRTSGDRNVTQDLTGVWRIWANSAGPDLAMRVQLKQNGNRLQGIVFGTNQPIEGTVTDRTVEFSRNGGGLRVPQRYKGFLFQGGSPPTLAGTFSHDDEWAFGWYGYRER